MGHKLQLKQRRTNINGKRLGKTSLFYIRKIVILRCNKILKIYDIMDIGD